jgi:hypothetical protein
MPRSRNWKDWFEGNPVKIFCGVGLATCTATVGVMTYLSGEEMKLEHQSAAITLEQTKSELSTRIHDLETRLVTIERRVGTEAIWDVSGLTVTPTQIKALGSRFVYNDKIQCYLAVPDLSSWKFVETDELGLGAMLANQTAESIGALGPLGEVAKLLKVYLWRGQESQQVGKGDSGAASLYIFPYVAVEVIRNKDFFQMMGKFAENTGQGQALADLTKTLDRLNEVREAMHELAKPSVSNHESTTEKKLDKDSGLTPEKVTQQLSEVYNSDTAGLFLCSVILQGFMTSMEFPHSTFRVLDSEKKGNVLYMHVQIIFPATGKTEKVYWDREIICIGNKESTYLISTSAPSLDQRPSAGSWITAWLAGLRIPLE